MSDTDVQSDVKPSHRFSIGIDLGTTNSVLSYVDLESDPDAPLHEIMPIAQLASPGVVEEHMQLPSFLYQAHESELSEGDRVLPWNAAPDALVGYIARNLGAKTPLRLVSSAKSWLCHGGVDRRSGFLPLNSPEEVEKVSPFSATVNYLSHLRDAWNHAHPEHLMESQDVTITIPASLDPAARELTAEAART